MQIYVASEYIQFHLNLITTWANNWRIKINETKSVQVNFTLRRNEIPPLILNGTCIPIQSSTKYLGIILDKRLTWSHHTKSKRKQTNIRLHLLRPILKSKISLAIKMLIYKSLIRPVWSYGIQIWGPAKPSNIRPLQSFQSIALRIITNAPWYLTNQNLQKDL
jgi:hypothetical protein